jgi:GTP-binding protein
VIPRLEISAASSADFPATGLPEIALVGRSNVGKSSLINALVKQKIARTSAAPGKTRLANFYLAEPPRDLRRRAGSKLYLVDLPGYGYARGGAESVESFEALTEQYFDRAANPRRWLAGIFHLVDARHADLRQDGAAHEWLLGHELPIGVVATKMDKLSQHDQVQTMKRLTARYGALVLPVSAMKQLGLPRVWETLREWTAR